MDPNATWLIINDESLSGDERMLAAENLLTWLCNGGFPPAGVTDPVAAVQEIIEDLVDTMMD